MAFKFDISHNMANICRIPIRAITFIHLWPFKTLMLYIGLIVFLDSLEHLSSFHRFASAEPDASCGSNSDKLQCIQDESRIDQLCNDCKLASESIEELLKQPRQMDSYGVITDRIDLEKIKKGICRSIPDDDKRRGCKEFYLNNIKTLEKWKSLNTRTTFFDQVCIKELKYCCPRNSFGPKCTKCNQCNQNEHCHGEGSRTGNGTCVCKTGYSGPNCNSCSLGYYTISNNVSDASHRGKSSQSSPHPVTCKTCHKSCRYCFHEGPLGCEVCQTGYVWLPGHGCSDIDECLQSGNKICGENTFCVNTEGSYFCYECDRACDGCHGDGPDMCLRCGKNYHLDSGYCIANKKTIIPPEANYYRYAVYTGLSICTCIILHNNVYVASVIGLAVALYIGYCEYIMSQHDGQITGTSNRIS